MTTIGSMGHIRRHTCIVCGRYFWQWPKLDDRCSACIAVEQRRFRPVSIQLAHDMACGGETDEAIEESCADIDKAIDRVLEPYIAVLRQAEAALTTVEDAASRRPWSTGRWPNEIHPAIGVGALRDALRAIHELLGKEEDK